MWWAKAGNNVSRILQLACAAFLTALLLALTGACGGSNSSQSEGALETTAPIATPTSDGITTENRTATSEGLVLHTTRNIEIALPVTWEAAQSNEEEFDDLIGDLEGSYPELVDVAQGSLSAGNLEFYAQTTEDMRFDHVIIARIDFPFDVPMSAILSEMESQVASFGVTILETDSSLEINGLVAGRIHASETLDSLSIEQLMYVVESRADSLYALTFTSEADGFERTAILFDRIAKSFNVTEE